MEQLADISVFENISNSISKYHKIETTNNACESINNNYLSDAFTGVGRAVGNGWGYISDKLARRHINKHLINAPASQRDHTADIQNIEKWRADTCNKLEYAFNRANQIAVYTGRRTYAEGATTQILKEVNDAFTFFENLVTKLDVILPTRFTSHIIAHPRIRSSVCIKPDGRVDLTLNIMEKNLAKSLTHELTHLFDASPGFNSTANKITQIPFLKTKQYGLVREADGETGKFLNVYDKSRKWVSGGLYPAILQPGIKTPNAAYANTIVDDSNPDPTSKTRFFRKDIPKDDTQLLNLVKEIVNNPRGSEYFSTLMGNYVGGNKIPFLYALDAVRRLKKARTTK